MTLESELTGEIKKWTAKLDKGLLTAKPLDERGVRLLENIRAYRKDSNHFRERGDLIKSFECLVWAWALLEIGKELNHLRS